MLPDLAIPAPMTPPAPVRTAFAPVQRVLGREVHGDRAALKLECGHVVDTDAATGLVAITCTACAPVEVPRAA